MNIAAFDFDFVKFAGCVAFMPIFGNLFHTWLNRPLNKFSTEITLSHTLNSTERATKHEIIFTGLKKKKLFPFIHMTERKTNVNFTDVTSQTLHLSMQPPTN